MIKLKLNPLLYLYMFCTFCFFTSCDKDDDDGPGGVTVEYSEVNDFIWEAMNQWYFWQADQSLLADNIDDDETSYADLLNSYSTPEACFEGLRYLPGEIDRFSFMTDDYKELANTFQGIGKSFGFDFGLLLFASDSDLLLGFVRYVLPDSPASQAGLKRGDIFTTVGGQQLTPSNYVELLFGENVNTYELGMAEILFNSIVPTGQTITVNAVELTENPVFLNKTFSLPDGRTVGYLVYNQFSAQFNDELNEVFGEFKSKNVTDLILDLRYNPGGSLLTCSFLSSMVYSNDPTEVFCRISYNNKKTSNNTDLGFFDKVNVYDENLTLQRQETLNSLGLNRLFVIATGGTASASEAVINCLRPYIPVTIIGRTTVGKNVGSLTLYDSPQSQYTDESSANPNHTYALQPIISVVRNSQGQSDYFNGFPPDVDINENSYLGEWKELGDPEEILLATAFDQICPGCVVTPNRAPHNEDAFLPIAERKEFISGYQSLTLDELFLE